MNDIPGKLKLLVRIRGRDPSEHKENLNTVESQSNLDRNGNNTKTSPLNLQRNRSSNPTGKASTNGRSKSPANLSKNFNINSCFY